MTTMINATDILQEPQQLDEGRMPKSLVQFERELARVIQLSEYAASEWPNVQADLPEWNMDSQAWQITFTVFELPATYLVTPAGLEHPAFAKVYEDLRHQLSVLHGQLAPVTPLPETRWARVKRVIGDWIQTIYG